VEKEGHGATWKEDVHDWNKWRRKVMGQPGKRMHMTGTSRERRGATWKEDVHDWNKWRRSWGNLENGR